MPVRWALEEAGLPYAVRLVSFAEMKSAAHRALHPFGQIPTFEDGDVALFESGAIVLHIAQGHPGLLPVEAGARARAIAWVFAAVSSVEPVVVQRETSLYLERDKPWHTERLSMVEERIRARLQELAVRLGEGPWLDGDFSAGDLLMVQVLRRLEGSDILDAFPGLADYIARARERPAFQRAFAAQRAVWEAQEKQ